MSFTPGFRIPIQMELNADLDPDLKHWGTGGGGGGRYFPAEKQ